MAKRIKVDGVIHSFPDDATDAEINAALPAQGGGTQPAQAPQPGLLSRAWNAVTTPVADLVSGGANITAKGLMQQATGDPFLYDSIRSSQSRGPSEADAKSPLKYAIKQGIGGVVADTADTVAGVSSPASIATMGLGVASKGVGAAAKLAQIGTKAVGTGFALKGTADVADAATNPDLSPAERAQKGFGGGAMMAGGRSGMMEQPAYGTLSKQFGEQAKAKFYNTVVPGSPSELLTRATKPTVGLPDYAASLERQIPEIHRFGQAQGKPISNLTDLTGAADAVREQAHADYRGLVNRVTKPVDVSRAATGQMNTIPALNLFEDPGIIGKTGEKANLYNTSIPAQQAEDIHVDTNAKLRGFYNKAAGDKHAALSNPETARIHAVNEGVKNSLYDSIQNTTNVDPRPLQQQYGDLTDIADTAGRRDTVFSRQQPIPLHQQISVAQSLGEGKPIQAGIAQLFKHVNDSNWLTKEAFDRYSVSQKPKTNGKFGYGSLAAAFAARQSNSAGR